MWGLTCTGESGVSERRRVEGNTCGATWGRGQANGVARQGAGLWSNWVWDWGVLCDAEEKGVLHAATENQSYGKRGLG